MSDMTSNGVKQRWFPFREKFRTKGGHRLDLGAITATGHPLNSERNIRCFEYSEHRHLNGFRGYFEIISTMLAGALCRQHKSYSAWLLLRELRHFQ